MSKASSIPGPIPGPVRDVVGYNGKPPKVALNAFAKWSILDRMAWLIDNDTSTAVGTVAPGRCEQYLRHASHATG
jgi:hypothetical protein